MYSNRVKTGQGRGILKQIGKLRRRLLFRNALSRLIKTEDGKVFFETFLEHCHVTKTQFSSDPMKVVEQESLRRLAMSYLSLLGRDNTETILAQFETENRQKQEQ